MCVHHVLLLYLFLFFTKQFQFMFSFKLLMQLLANFDFFIIICRSRIVFCLFDYLLSRENFLPFLLFGEPTLKYIRFSGYFLVRRSFDASYVLFTDQKIMRLRVMRRNFLTFVVAWFFIILMMLYLCVRFKHGD